MIQDLWALQVAGPQKADICCIIHLREFVPLSLSLTLTPSKSLTLQSAGWVLAVSVGNVDRKRQRKYSGLILNICTHYSWAYSCLIDKRPREFILKRKVKINQHIIVR